jgi:hypothetical protein
MEFITYSETIKQLPDSRSMDSVVGITTGSGMDDWGVGVRIPIGSRIFSYPDWLWGPPSLLANWYRGFISRGKEAGAYSWPVASN